MNLESPHNDERCVCSDSQMLENASIKDCAFIYKKFSFAMDDIRQSITASIKDAIEQTNKHRGLVAASEVGEIMNAYINHHEASVMDLLSDINLKIVELDQNKCPYCQ